MDPATCVGPWRHSRVRAHAYSRRATQTSRTINMRTASLASRASGDSYAASRCNCSQVSVNCCVLRSCCSRCSLACGTNYMREQRINVTAHVSAYHQHIRAIRQNHPIVAVQGHVQQLLAQTAGYCHNFGKDTWWPVQFTCVYDSNAARSHGSPNRYAAMTRDMSLASILAGVYRWRASLRERRRRGGLGTGGL